MESSVVTTEEAVLVVHLSLDNGSVGSTKRGNLDVTEELMTVK